MSAQTETGEIMSVTFPRKFVHGQKVDNVEVHGELHVWPDGRFHFRVHIHNYDPHKGNCFHVSFALLDEKHVPLGTYGMPADQAWYVGPLGHYQASRRNDELYGEVPEDKLKKTGAVALLFRPQNQALDAAGLQGLATLGSELLFCPIPD